MPDLKILIFLHLCQSNFNSISTLTLLYWAVFLLFFCLLYNYFMFCRCSGAFDSSWSIKLYLLTYLTPSACTHSFLNVASNFFCPVPLFTSPITVESLNQCAVWYKFTILLQVLFLSNKKDIINDRDRNDMRAQESLGRYEQTRPLCPYARAKLSHTFR